MKKILLSAFMSLAILSHAKSATAELLPEQYYFIVANYPAPQDLLEFEGTIGGKKFLALTGQIAEEESKRCNADVFVHYSNMMGNSEAEWAEGWLFAYIGGYDDRQDVLDEASQSACFGSGYLKRGAAIMPSKLFICATGEGLEEIGGEAACEGY